MYRLRAIFLISLLTLAPALPWPAAASMPERTLILDAGDSQPSLHSHLSWYRDTTGDLTLADIVSLQSEGKMIAAPGYPSFGYTDDAIWVYFRIEQSSRQHGHWLLSIAPAFLDQVQLFRVGDTDSTGFDMQGDRQGWAGRAIPWRHALFEVDMLPGEQASLYLRIESSSSIAVTPRLWSQGQFVTASNEDMLLYGMLLATGTLLCSLALFLFSLLRQRVYLYFLIYVAVFTFVIAQLEGVIHLLLNPEQPIHLEGLQVVLQSIGMLSMIMLFSEITELRRHHPRSNQLLIRAGIIAAIAGLLPAAFGHHNISIPLLWAPIALLSAAIPLATFSLRRHIGLVAHLYTAAFAVIGLVAIIRLAWVFGLTEPNMLSENNFAIGMLLHVIFLFLTLAAKYAQLEKNLRTARDSALQSIQQSEKRLESLVEQRTSDLDEANKRLAEQLRISNKNASDLEQTRDRLSTALEDEQRASLEQRRFLRMVAHEFRTPLSVIQMAADMIKADPRTPDIHATNCERIQTASERMASLINQALREDKLDSAMWRKDSAFIPVIDILHAGVNHGEMISSGKHAISLHCDEDLTIQGDYDLLITMINNIIDNAVKYSPAGSPISVSASSNDQGSVCITITDQGRGINADERQQILEKYFRAADSTDVPGMGLGLYLVDKIVRLHSASLSVESEIGSGTTFTLIFPGIPVEQETKQ